MRLHGSITALATPIDASAEVDLPAWNALVARQIAAGTQALVVAGSTGEAATLSDAEYLELLRATAVQAKGVVPILAGTGLAGTEKTIAQCRFARDAGADMALVVTPPYVRPTQEGLRRHYLEVAERGDLPVVLYNVPGRSGCDLLPATVAQLVRHPNIVGIKEARAEPERMAELLTLQSSDFSVLSGDDPTACRALLAGADGVISVASNAAPAAFRQMVERACAGMRDAAEQADAALRPIYDLLSAEPNPIPLKALLAALGLCHDALRLPLLPLSAAYRAGLSDLAALATRLESDGLRARAA